MLTMHAVVFVRYVNVLSTSAVLSGGTECATSANEPLLRLQSSEGKFTTSREVELVRRSFRRHGSCTFSEVALLVPSGPVCVV